MADKIIVSLAATAARLQARMTQFVARTTSQTHDDVGRATLQILGVTRAGTPVDTGALRGAWSQPRPIGLATWTFGNSQDYAPIVEYGLYRRIGPRTMRGGGVTLGEFHIGGGIFSQQAPVGMLRRALATGRPDLFQRLITTHQRLWGR